MSQTEQQFVSTYTQLISLSSSAPTNTFNFVGDYHKLESLGPSLPILKVEFPSEKQQIHSKSSTITLNFKSIKPPFKFTHSLEANTNQSIYKVKSDLISAVETLKNAGVQPGDIKFLVKGKVYQDTASLSLFSEPEVSFMCMVSAPSSSSVAKGDDPDDVPVEDVLFASLKTISSETWNEIVKLLVKDLDETQAKALVEKWKQTVRQ